MSGVVALDSNPDQAIELIGRLTSGNPRNCISLLRVVNTDGQLISENDSRRGTRIFDTSGFGRGSCREHVRTCQPPKIWWNMDGRNSQQRSDRHCWCGTGGVGTTSTAVNRRLRACRGHDEQRCLCWISIWHSETPMYSWTQSLIIRLADVVQNVSRLDIQLLKRSLTKHSSGLYLLPRPVELHDTNAITC